MHWRRSSAGSTRTQTRRSSTRTRTSLIWPGSGAIPAFKPDWSPDLFLHRMYTCHLMVVRKEVFESAGGFRTGYEGAQDYDLLLRVMERTDRISHLPRILYHWRKLPQSTASAGAAKPWAMDAGRLALEDYVARRGLDAEVLPGGAPGLFRMKRRIAGEPLVSIVIPTAGRMRDDRGAPSRPARAGDRAV